MCIILVNTSCARLGYYKKAFEITKKYGGVNIMDEVQTGFGRLGSHYWGFEYHGVKPDIITAAKSELNSNIFNIFWIPVNMKSLKKTPATFHSQPPVPQVSVTVSLLVCAQPPLR